MLNTIRNMDRKILYIIVSLGILLLPLTLGYLMQGEITVTPPSDSIPLQIFLHWFLGAIATGFLSVLVLWTSLIVRGIKGE